MFLKIFMLASVLVSLIFLWGVWTSRKKFIKSREKSSPFECGFDPKDKARMPFSLRFFIIMILFMMFDVELSLLLQIPLQFEFGYFKNRVLLSLFVWILVLGTLEEWRRGVLDWKEWSIYVWAWEAANFLWSNLIHTSVKTFSKMKWVNKMALLMMISLGIIVSLSSSNLFIVWFGLELNMFGIMPFMLLKNSEEGKNQLNVGLYYFMIQVFGSLLFSWGSMMGNSNMLGVVGLLMKMGVSPFFWWVPSVFSRLDWLSMFLLSSVQKVPVILLIRSCFDLDMTSSLLMCLSGFFMSMVGMKFSTKSMKSLMAWSSMGKMSMTLLLLVHQLNLGFMYFLCYTLSVGVFIWYIYFTKKNVLSNNSSNSENSKNLKIISFFLLMFSGLPPLFGFMSKVILFSGLSLAEKDMMWKQMGVFMKFYGHLHFVMDYPNFNLFLRTWTLSIMMSLGLMLQTLAYMKMFMNVFIASSWKLQNSGRKLTMSFADKMMCLMMLCSSLPLLLL